MEIFISLSASDIMKKNTEVVLFRQDKTDNRENIHKLKEFDIPISEQILNISDKNRSNLFAWRGQFSPQLIEAILKAYCLPNSIILDPFFRKRSSFP